MSTKLSQILATLTLLALPIFSEAKVIPPLDRAIGQELLSHMTPVHSLTPKQRCELNLSEARTDKHRAFIPDDWQRLKSQLKTPASQYLVVNTPSRVLSWKQWDFLSFAQKQELFRSIRPYSNNALEMDDTVLYSFDLIKLTEEEFWKSKLAPETLKGIEAFKEHNLSELVAKLKKRLNLDLENSGYYPGFDDDILPIGTIGDWHISELNSFILPDGSTVAHKIYLTQKGFMRRAGDEEAFDPNIAVHYNTLEEALAAGGSKSDVSWQYEVVVNYDFEITSYDRYEAPQWSGF
ncbi:hypothetical protein GW915_13645 [bacterium]|nr:hypothetical protein [bacterium]